ncbi:MAG: BatD family protein [Treponema sp.]|jgi:hypothetical protein|nr:BatD family protein [Treponema sp.]
MGNITIKQRRLIIRSALVVVWICLGALLFVLNRGHSILVDNHDIEALNLRAPDMIKITIDQNKPAEFFRRDRDIFEVGGGGHRVRVEFSDGSPAVEKTFSLPLMPDMFLLSIPKMLNNVDPFYEVFRSEPEIQPEDEKTQP